MNKKKIIFSLIILSMAFSLLMNFTTIKGEKPENILSGTLQTSDCELWEANGTIICNAANDQQQPQIVSDGAGGAILTWHDYRNSGTGADIFAQKISIPSAGGGSPNIPGFNLTIIGVIFTISVISVTKMLNRKKKLIDS